MPEKKNYTPISLDPDCEGWDELACAIMAQAVKDLRDNMEQQLDGKVTKKSCDMICSVESFFRSDLCCSIFQGEPQMLLYTLMGEVHEKHIDQWTKLSKKIVSLTKELYYEAALNTLVNPGNVGCHAAIIRCEEFIHSKWFSYVSRCDPDQFLENIFLGLIDNPGDLQLFAPLVVSKTKQKLVRLSTIHKENPSLNNLLDKVQGIQNYMHTEWFKWLETI